MSIANEAQTLAEMGWSNLETTKCIAEFTTQKYGKIWQTKLKEFSVTVGVWVVDWDHAWGNTHEYFNDYAEAVTQFEKFKAMSINSAAEYK